MRSCLEGWPCRSVIVLAFFNLVHTISKTPNFIYLEDVYNKGNAYLVDGKQNGKRMGQCQKELKTRYRYNISSNKNHQAKRLPFTEDELAWLRKLRSSYESRAFPVVRKEIRMLSSSELAKLSRAFNRLNKDTVSKDSMHSKYTLFAIMHSEQYSPAATRNGPGNLGWHREYILLLEEALREIEPDVAMPFWDSTYDSMLWKPQISIVWDDKYFGDCEARFLDWTVKNGLFANWDIDSALYSYGTGLGEMNQSSILERNCAVEWDYLPFTMDEIAVVLNESSYSNWYKKKGGCFTKDHDQLHWFIGGMTHSYVTLATVDPVAWFMHTFLDYVWEIFRTSYQQTEKNIDYPDSSEITHSAFSSMAPFEKENIDGISTVYTDSYYVYQAGPKQCSNNNACAKFGDYFCLNKKCQTKFKKGSMCLKSDNACKSMCITHNTLKYCM